MSSDLNKGFLLLLVLLFLGCNSNEESLSMLRVDVDRDNPTPLSEITQNVSIILLETNDKSLLERVDELVVTDQFIFVTDSHRILCFDRTGKFISQIGSEGRRPGEYTYVKSIAADPVRKILYAATVGKIISFSFDDKVIMEYRKIRSPEKLYFLDDKLWVIFQRLGIPIEEGANMNEAIVSMIDSQWNVIDSLVMLKFVQKRVSAATPPAGLQFISEVNDTIYGYYPSLLSEDIVRDTLFQFAEQGRIPSVKLDFGFERKDDVNILTILDMVRCGHFLFSWYYYNGKSRLFCHDFSQDISYNMESGFTDDLNNMGKIRIQFLNTASRECYYVKNSDEVVGKIDGVSEDSNPTLFLFQLRE